MLIAGCWSDASDASGASGASGIHFPVQRVQIAKSG